MSATKIDRWGVELQAGSEEGVRLWDQAVDELVRLAGDPLATARAAVDADDQLTLARVFVAYVHLYGTTGHGVRSARLLLEGLDGAGLAPRERLHVEAAWAWAAGDWPGATRKLEDALLLDPRDLVALKVAQDLYFFLGDRLDLRDVAARVLPSWPEGLAGWSYVQGMYAFGLEENGDYRAAEAAAGRALDAAPEDVWAAHALAHVFEMESRAAEGADFLTASSTDWAPSYFAIHNWWHLALFDLDLKDRDGATGLYDGPVRSVRSSEWLDIVDAAALLWRLSLFGVDVTSRAAQLADDVEGIIEEPVYVFNDWHAAMALGLAERHDRSRRLVADNESKASGHNRVVFERAGRGLISGFSAFAGGDYGATLDALIDIRPAANVVGGSHAQRDVIDLTLIAAASRLHREPLVRALLAERAARRHSVREVLAPLLSGQ
jgi:tetratricopeptide (TPR) repeat protein